MRRMLQPLSFGIVMVFASAGYAGWTVQWSTTAFNQRGVKMPTESATQSIADSRVRMQQPAAITITDYPAGRFTILNPAKKFFWSGTVDEYVRESARNRAEALNARVGQMLAPKGDGQKDSSAQTDFMPKAIDPAKLPPVSVTNTGLKEKVAGYDTEKYEVRVDGELFQELWVAPALNVSADWNLDQRIAVQRKMSANMIGKSAAAYNAIYRNDEYRNLLAKGFMLKEIARHLAGGSERVATVVQQGEIPATSFEIPADYRKVRLADVLEAPPLDTPPPAPGAKGA